MKRMEGRWKEDGESRNGRETSTGEQKKERKERKKAAARGQLFFFISRGSFPRDAWPVIDQTAPERLSEHKSDRDRDREETLNLRPAAKHRGKTAALGVAPPTRKERNRRFVVVVCCGAPWLSVFICEHNTALLC